MAWCKNSASCHKVEHGMYGSDFWIGDTSKDQYSGWFYGMSMAYDCIDDENVKSMIRQDVTIAIDRLIKDKWIILDEQGKYHVISAGQRPVYVYQISWLTIAYHMTGNLLYKMELDKRMTWYNFLIEEIGSITGYFNHYTEYYGNNLAHTTWYNLLRLGKIYFSANAYTRLKGIFTRCVHEKSRLSHNPWFNAIYMSQGEYTPLPSRDPYKEQYVEDILAFRPAPFYTYHMLARDPSTYVLDPAVSWLVYFPGVRAVLAYFNVGIKPQALYAFPIKSQCYNGFLFQGNPYRIDACGTENRLYIEPGHDYLAAYWLGVYSGIIDPSQ